MVTRLSTAACHTLLLLTRAFGSDTTDVSGSRKGGDASIIRLQGSSRHKACEGRSSIPG